MYNTMLSNEKTEDDYFLKFYSLYQKFRKFPQKENKT